MLILEPNQTYVGAFVSQFTRPNIARILKSAGLDYFILDCEHGMLSMESVEDIISVANAVGILPLVRIPMITRQWVGQALDAGAAGLIVPYIRSADEVRQLVQLAKYPPLGQRGVALQRGNTGFMPVESVKRYTQMMNEKILIFPQIETLEAVDAMEEIADVPGIAGLFLGTLDLSVLHDYQEASTSQAVDQAVLRMIAVCRQRGLLSAAHINHMPTLRRWIGQGLNLADYQSDATLLIQAFRQAARQLREKDE